MSETYELFSKSNIAFTKDESDPQEEVKDSMHLQTIVDERLPYAPNETRRMTKNIVVVSIGFLLLFTAYNGMSNLQSSLHPEGINSFVKVH